MTLRTFHLLVLCENLGLAGVNIVLATDCCVESLAWDVSTALSRIYSFPLVHVILP